MGYRRGDDGMIKTRAEAIDIIKGIKEYMRISDKNSPYKFLDEDYEALDAGISALEEPTVKEIEREYEMSKALFQKMVESEDTVSRADVRQLITKVDREKGGISNKSFKALYDGADELPSVTQKSGEWIPVSEPPKELGTYLIQTDGEPYMCQCRWTDVNPFWTDYKTKPHWNIFDLPQYSKVVAWMSLPTPYEPQESEDKE